MTLNRFDHARWLVLSAYLSSVAYGIPLSMPNVDNVRDCAAGPSTPISTDLQFTTAVKDQGDSNTCYGQAATGLLEAFVYRKTGRPVALSAESNLCDYLARQPPQEIARRAQNLQNGESGRTSVASLGSPAYMLSDFRRAPWPIRYEKPAVRARRQDVFRKTDKLAEKGGFRATEKICRALDKGPEVCRDESAPADPRTFSDLEFKLYDSAAGTKMFESTSRLFHAIREGHRGNIQRALRECDVASEPMRRLINRNLCLGIPMTGTLQRLGGLESAPAGTTNYTLSPMPVVMHSVVLTGIERDPSTGKMYYVFRNSEGTSRAKIRLSFEESCEIGALSWITSQADRNRTEAALAAGSSTVVEDLAH